MRITDLGELSGQVIVFGGPYSNLQALDAMIRAAQEAGVPAANMICTGDVVAYGADPGVCVDRIAALGCPVIAGNCEEQLAANAPDCGCGFEEGSTCSTLSISWYAHGMRSLTDPQRRWMGGLPARITFRHNGRRYGVIHGGADATSRFLWPCASDAALAGQIADLEGQLGPLDTVLCGHSGLSFVRNIGRHNWVNAGVIGMPENDGRVATRYATLDPEPRIHLLSYDHEAARSAMIEAGLDQGYHTALRTGYWPSEDVLPPDLRRGRA